MKNNSDIPDYITELWLAGLTFWEIAKKITEEFHITITNVDENTITYLHNNSIIDNRITIDNIKN
jgi:hypothetical protein